MEPFGHLLPAEIHHGHEGTLHEECHDTLDGQRRSEDVTHEPGIVRPVGAELKFEDDARGHSHRKIDTEEALPELSRLAPEHVARAVVLGFHNGHNQSESQRQGDEKPVVDGRECELRSRPIDG